MSTARIELAIALEKYVSNTFDYIRTVKGFVDRSLDWESAREAEIDEIIRIKKDEDDDSDEKDLSDLTVILEKVRGGLREMGDFLRAMEMLSVTSVHVFEDENPGFKLTGSDLESVRGVIQIAQALSPMLLLFKRNNEAYFQPNLDNMEALLNQLKKYNETIKTICEEWRESSLIEKPLNEPKVEEKDDLSKVLPHMNILNKIRMDDDFRMMCLFEGREHKFKAEFQERAPQMEQFLKELEDCAAQLDSMCKGASISGVVSSSVGLTGGVLSILGLIFLPFTAGASLALTAAGTLVSVSGGVTSVVTSVTTIGVSEAQAQKAKENFKEFVEVSSKIQCCLDDVIQEHFNDLHNSSKIRGAKMSIPAVRLTLKAISVPGLSKNIKAFTATGQLASAAAGEGLTVIGKAGKALSKVAGPLNVLFMGVDIYGIVTHTKHLQDCESQTSKWIRARVALWRAEVESWRDIYDSLHRAKQESEEWKDILTKPLDF